MSNLMVIDETLLDGLVGLDELKGPIFEIGLFHQQGCRPYTRDNEEYYQYG